MHPKVVCRIIFAGLGPPDLAVKRLGGAAQLK